MIQHIPSPESFLLAYKSILIEGDLLLYLVELPPNERSSYERLSMKSPKSTKVTMSKWACLSEKNF
jgi:hypothetical protein